MRFLALVGLMLAAVSVRGGALAPPPPLTHRLVRANAVVVGKVVSFEEKTIKAKRYAGDREKGEYRIAIVKVEEGLLNVKGLTHVRVGLLPPILFLGSGGVPRTLPTATLFQGQTVLLVLTSHAKETFYTMPNANDALGSQASNYRAEVELARRCCGLLADTAAGLKAKEPGDRVLAANLLLGRCRMARPGHSFKPIPAVQSRAILQVLVEADWTRQDSTTGQAEALTLFYQLGAEPADGWHQPADFRKVPEAARSWVKDNAEKFRIKGFVSDSK